MRPSRENRAVSAALRCYPGRWRSRHGDEASLLASSLLEDGVPWWSITLSFLGGAGRERLLRKPSLPAGTILAAIAVGVAAVPLALLSSLTPADASNTNVVIVISNRSQAAQQLEAAFASHRFKITVIEKAVPKSLAGTILSLSTVGTPSFDSRVVAQIRGPCVGGDSGCVVGVVLPLHFSGDERVTIGRSITPGGVRRP
jgi:hypothetical protein